MQQFTVPQFIDVEDKIIGPITARQFMIMLGGFMLIAICYKLFDFSLFIFLGIIIFAISGVVAFFKINGMPFHFFILNFVQTSSRPWLRIWNNRIAKDFLFPEVEINNSKMKIVQSRSHPYTTSRLAELSLIVDTRGAYQGKKHQQNKFRIKK